MSAQINLTIESDRSRGGSPRRLFWKAMPYLLAAAIFTLILYHVPVSKTWDALQDVPLLKFAALLMPLAVLYLLIDSYCLKWVIQRFSTPIRFSEAVPVRASMYLPSLVNNNLGIAGIAYYLRQRHKIGFLEALSSVLFISFIDIYEIFIFSGIGMMFYVPRRLRIQSLVVTMQVIYVAAWIFLAALIVVAAVARRRPAVSRWIRHTRIGAFTGAFLKAMPLDYAVLFLFKSVGFACALAVTYLTLQLYGLKVAPAKLVALLPLVYLVAAIPITIAQLGTVEGAWMILFKCNGSPGRLLAYGLAVHLLFMGSIAIIGACFIRRASRDLVSSRKLAQLPSGHAKPPVGPVSGRGVTARPGRTASDASDCAHSRAPTDGG